MASNNATANSLAKASRSAITMVQAQRERYLRGEINWVTYNEFIVTLNRVHNEFVAEISKIKEEEK